MGHFSEDDTKVKIPFEIKPFLPKMIGFSFNVVQGQPRQTGFFELALRDRIMQVRFFWMVFLKS